MHHLSPCFDFGREIRTKNVQNNSGIWLYFKYLMYHTNLDCEVTSLASILEPLWLQSMSTGLLCGLGGKPQSRYLCIGLHLVSIH